MTEEEQNMRDQIVLITGATAGLGLHAAKEYYRRGATLLLTCRDHVRGKAAVDDIHASCGVLVQKTESDEDTVVREAGGGGDGDDTVDRAVEQANPRIHLFELELTDYRSVLQFAQDVAKTVPRVDVVVCNAGIMGLPFELSREGVERHFHSNHLGHFIMVNHLLPLLIAAPSARVLVVTSGLYKGAEALPTVKELMGETLWDYQSRKAYAVSKLANCLYVKALASRLTMSCPTVSVYAIRPGFVRGTELGRETHWLLRKVAAPLIWLVSRSLDKGITGYIHCATAAKETLKNGALYFDTQEEEYLPTVTEEHGDFLWRCSREIEELIVRRRENLTVDERRLYQEARNRLPG